MCVAGPNHSGKITFVVDLLKHRHQLETLETMKSLKESMRNNIVVAYTLSLSTCRAYSTDDRSREIYDDEHQVIPDGQMGSGAQEYQLHRMQQAIRSTTTLRQ